MRDTTRPKEDRTEIEEEVWELPWVISTMACEGADYVIQTNTPYVGDELAELRMMGLEVTAISSFGPNGSLKLHVVE